MSQTHTAFVAGATGYTGRSVVEALRARGIRTLAHIRGDSRRLPELGPRFASLGAEVVTTAWEPEAIAALLAAERPTLVFALLGTTAANAKAERARTGREVDYERVDYGLTKLLLDACVKAGHAPRFVYLSSIGTSASAPGAYMQARWKAEQAITTRGVPFTIVRPSFISGDDRDEPRPGERFGAEAARLVLGAAAALGAKRLQRRWAPMTGATLAGAMVSLALDPAWAGRVCEGEAIPRDA